MERLSAPVLDVSVTDSSTDTLCMSRCSSIETLDLRLFRWQEEADSVLTSQKFELIRQILRFRLYQSRDHLEAKLVFRFDHSLNRILHDLELHEETLLDRPDKIQMILNETQPRQVALTAEWAWTNDLDAGGIAKKIDNESCSLFRDLCFEDLIESSGESNNHLLTYRLDLQHLMLYHKIDRHLKEYPIEKGKFSQVKEVSPPAYICEQP